MTDHTPLSPAAQAVLKAADDAIGEWPPVWEKAIAAVLRAAADQVVPMALCVHNDDFVYVRHQLQAIAAELEGKPPQYLTLIFCNLSLEERRELIYNPKLRASSWGPVINQRINRDVMLDQLSQAAETLRDCWIERTGLTIHDDPYVEDACSVIESIRTERLRGKDFDR